MAIIDDSMLALIARFVVDDINCLTISDEQFLRQQVSEIKKQIENFPEEQREKAVLSWIQEHAELYRKEWKQRAFSDILLCKRCNDCPILGDGSANHCVIHKKWTSLLKKYMNGEMNSEKYIEKNLKLLHKHKDELKISSISKKLN
jgi:hypothetical protein